MNAVPHVEILLVDDRDENLIALEAMLANEDYTIIKANSGKEALKILMHGHDFAIILMDVQMPVMDGFETAALIREREKLKHVPIIFLTADTSNQEDVFKGYKTGAVDYMVKPVSPEILKAKVAVFVELYKKTQELIIQGENMKALNDKLQQQSQYVRGLIEATLDPLITINSEGKITDMNDALTRITGIPREQITGTDFFNYFTKPGTAKEVYEEIFEKGSIVDYLLTIRHKNGKLTDVLFNGSVYKDANGNVLGVVVVAREKLLSKYSRSLIEASLDPLITINSEGKITDMNEALANITGITREKITGTDFFDYFTDREKAREVYKEVFAKSFVVDFPLTIRHIEGKNTDVLFNGSVYKDDRGNVLGVVIVARDITARKKFENDLIEAKSNAEKAKKAAEEAVKAKQQFLSNMSHEIRTPLNAIIGFTKVVLKTSLTDKQKEYVSAIKISGDALIVLINDILDLAKVDAGKMSFEQIPFKLSASIYAMIHLFETKINEKNIQLIKKYDSSIPEVLEGDPVRLHQVILNLVSNAVKFTTNGKITITVKMVKEDDQSATIKFSVTDTGIGIPESKINSIFDNFQQATSGTARLYGGTGLGLAIVKQLIESQGGSVSVKSKVGEGSTFSFTLAFKKTKEKVEKESDHDVIIHDGAHNIRILVAEDVVLNQLLMKTLLEEHGFQMDIAANGRIAIEKLQKETYDIILMDLQMPEKNGYEATEYIRKELKLTIPIIALTADVTTADVEKCKAVGMDDYLSKPIDDKLLYKKLNKYLSRINLKNSEVMEEKPGKENDKCTNLDFLKQLTKNNPDFIAEMIKVYLEETPQLLNNMKEGLETGDYDKLKASAHSILPSFSTMGIAEEYTDMVKTIQEYAIKKESKEKIQPLLNSVEAICEKAYVELQKEMVALEK
ncbi:MAG: histidine kinase [Bacteroidetes bacterium]|nr:histidine kinase [Bacteroidota bacterium]